MISPSNIVVSDARSSHGLDCETAPATYSLKQSRPLRLWYSHNKVLRSMIPLQGTVQILYYHEVRIPEH